LKCLILIIILLVSFSTPAEVEVIVHPDNSNNLTVEDIKSIFLGQQNVFPDGAEAIPISLPYNDQHMIYFTKNLLKKSQRQLNAYWAIMIFSGNGSPPRQFESVESILSLVRKNPKLIAFIPEGSDSSGARSVLGF